MSCSAADRTASLQRQFFGAIVAQLSFLFFCGVLTAAHATSKDYDGIWNGELRCEGALWSTGQVNPFSRNLPSIEIKDGRVSQTIRQSGSSGATQYDHRVTVNLNDATPQMRIEQEYTRGVVQPANSNPSNSWVYSFVLSQKNPQEQLYAGTQRWVQRSQERPCQLRLTSVTPHPHSLAGRASGQQRLAVNSTAGRQAERPPQPVRNQPPERALERLGNPTPSSVAQTGPSQPTASSSSGASSPAAVTPPSQPIQNPDRALGVRQEAVGLRLRDQFQARLGQETAQLVFVGHSSDLVFFTNETPGAPNFARRLNGEGFFRGNVINICRLGALSRQGEAFQNYVSGEILRETPSLRIAPAQFLEQQCAQSNTLTGIDLVAVRRSEILSDNLLQSQVVAHLEARRMRVYKIVSSASFDLLLETRNASLRRHEEQLLAGSLNGVGWILVSQTSQNICATPTEDREFVTRAIKEISLASPFDRTPSEPLQLTLMSLDDIFINTKAGRCGFIFGEGRNLGVFFNALRRDGFSSQAAAIYLREDEARNIIANIALERQEAQRNINQQREADVSRVAEERRLAAERQVAAERQARLDEARRRNDEAARREELERMRALVSSRGRALVDGFKDRIQNHLSSVKDEVAGTQRRSRAGQVLTEAEQRQRQAAYQQARLDAGFPEWAREILIKIQEEWEFSDVRMLLEDYGQSRWRSRQIETVSVRVELPISNRIIGERETLCYNFVWINDDEFSMMRNTQSFSCEEYESKFREWSTANSFRSQWRLPSQ
jgi:hypothetical protein